MSPKRTLNQQAKIDQLLNAPAGGWTITGVYTSAFLPTDKVAVRMENAKLKQFVVVLPSGELVKPKPGRKTIDNGAIAWAL